MQEVFEKIIEKFSNIHRVVKNDEDLEWNRAVYKCIEIVKQEAEQYNNGWIPCSERLPEESGYYLTWVNYDGDEFANIDEIDCDGVLKEWNCMEGYEIIAWQPLPEQYHPKGE